MTDRALEAGHRRFWLLGAFVALCLLTAFGYVALAMRRSSAPSSPEPGVPAASLASKERTGAGVESALARLRTEPRVYYRSLRDGERGRIVVASLARLEEARWVSGLSCDRAHFGRRHGICVRREASSFTSRVTVELVGEDLKPRHQFEFDGVPSRARVAADERFAAATLFVTGDDYEADFSTRTKLFELSEGRLLPDIEFFDVQREGQAFQRIDFNYWGITFTGDSAQAYATLGTENTTYLVKADIQKRTVETLRGNVECPSLSPSGSRLVYKKRLRASGDWRLHVLDLGSFGDHAVGAERRSIDDQVEWLDEQHILYAVPIDPERPEQGTNLWVSSVEAGSSEPARIFIESAASPSVVR